MKIERLAMAGLFAFSAASCGGAASGDQPKPTPELPRVYDGPSNSFSITRLYDGSDTYLITGDIARGVLFMRGKGCSLTDLSDDKAGMTVKEIMGTHEEGPLGIKVHNSPCLPIK